MTMDDCDLLSTPMSRTEHPSHTPLSRRRALALIGAAGTSILVACSDSGDSTSSTTTAGNPDTTGVTSTDSTPVASGDVTPTPSETSGPFPSDGTNDDGSGQAADVLHDPRAVRSDIRSNLDGSETQPGVPLTLRMRLVSKSVPLAGAAVYVWHCNKDGAYSDYNSRMLGGDYSAYSYLRGVQVADADGRVEFQTILPGRYPGRAFHIHFAVYSDEGLGTKLLTSQMAIDDDLIDSLFTSAAGYENSLRADTDNSQDQQFGDGVDHQLLTVTGDVASGLTADFTAVV